MKRLTIISAALCLSLLTSGCVSKTKTLTSETHASAGGTAISESSAAETGKSVTGPHDVKVEDLVGCNVSGFKAGGLDLFFRYEICFIHFVLSLLSIEKYYLIIIFLWNKSIFAYMCDNEYNDTKMTIMI